MTTYVEDDCQSWEWIDALDVVHGFTAANGIVPGRSQGTGMPPTRRTDLRVPGRAGAIVLDRTYSEKTMALEVTLLGADEESVEEALASWARRFNVLLGGGRLRRTRADGVTKRLLYCDYDSGFEIDQAAGLWGEGAQQAVLSFFAADPFWYDDDPTVLPFNAGGDTGLGFFPIPNPITGSMITLAASEIYGTVSVNNDGDVPVYPVWTITGPGSNIALRNITTGAELVLSQNGGLLLSDLQVLTIDTRPGEGYLELGDGTNVAAYLTDASELWPLALGNNDLQVELSGATGDTEVELSYRRGWLTP